MRRAAVWVRDDLSDVQTRLLDRSGRRRLLVPTLNGTFVVGPNPVTERTIKDTRAVLGGGIGLVWTDTGIVVEHADYFDADPALPAIELFQQEGLPAEAELIRWLDQGGADAAVPTHPRPWWEKLFGERSTDRRSYKRSRGLAGEMVLRVGTSVLCLSALWLAFDFESLPPFLQWWFIILVPVGVIDVVGALLAASRWRQQFPVLDPLGLRTDVQVPR
ncbi:hypothetical protein SAMN05192558_10573 [Actinokineospora alba]|uniref:Uncharacterized protein n=1 Tax=Actinokineospora alba TaxID=504798 RepID=A0A1H0MV73_9PSEU|nr:hypothetical protein [Actinokineospora alba]TDP68446.1 hypothetical protein C8E96_4011 [Actinokineospora alba]SDH79241.1 hypothetical protein SAMN05421871_102123 [Actinokineospora alba]SDO84281.1 hypothetical protein SAMN05192558_10573 [Actinokineospora alba]